MGRDFGSTYVEQVGAVYAFFAYRLSARDDAEDLTQQTFERALRAWSRYDETRAPVGTWLMAIARNLLVDHYRARGGSRRKSLDIVGEERLGVEWPQERLGLDPDLARALGDLSARDRGVIALRFGADLTGPEIAEATTLTLANVQQILSRSLRRLRAALEERAPT
ncbi:MAG TPA: sigma-70 family RNA polymerase sigma factor [Solirubrobacterales bacterium]|nr:sigma-70 family RNA polymerase sigma factor [Solirubrobacterales bacterium]